MISLRFASKDLGVIRLHRSEGGASLAEGELPLGLTSPP